MVPIFVGLLFLLSFLVIDAQQDSRHILNQAKASENDSDPLVQALQADKPDNASTEKKASVSEQPSQDIQKDKKPDAQKIQQETPPQQPTQPEAVPPKTLPAEKPTIKEPEKKPDIPVTKPSPDTQQPDVKKEEVPVETKMPDKQVTPVTAQPEKKEQAPDEKPVVQPKQETAVKVERKPDEKKAVVKPSEEQEEEEEPTDDEKDVEPEETPDDEVTPPTAPQPELDVKKAPAEQPTPKQEAPAKVEKKPEDKGAPVAVPPEEQGEPVDDKKDVEPEKKEKPKPDDEVTPPTAPKPEVKKEKAETAEKPVDQEKEIKPEEKKAAVPKPPAPQKVEPEKLAPEEEDEQEDAMQAESEIDTIDLDEGGNWLLKRKALEDTAEAIEKLNKAFVKVIDVSSTYKVARNKVDSELDVLISNLGFGLGDLDQTLSNLLEDLEQERKEEGDLSADERDILYKVNEKKQEIKQLRESLQSLFGLEQNLDMVLNTVDTQVKTANNYQVQAWKNFQEIKQVLSDEKAEDLYYRSEGLYQSVEDIFSYLDKKLMDYFNEQVSNLRAQMNDIKNKVESLQKSGIDLKSKFQQVEEQEEQEKKEEEKVTKPKEKVGWWQTIKRILWAPFDYIYRGFSYLASFFMPAKKAPSIEQTPGKSPSDSAVTKPEKPSS